MAEPRWLTQARRYIGLREITGARTDLHAGASITGGLAAVLGPVLGTREIQYSLVEWARTLGFEVVQ